MRTTAMAALVAVGVLAAAGTDRTDEALPGESPFTKAPTTASLALLATTIGGGVSAPVTASANSGALIGATFAFNVVGGGAVTQTGAAGQAGAGRHPTRSSAAAYLHRLRRLRTAARP